MKVEIEVDLRSKLSAIRNQGARPTCLAHATTAAHEKCRGSITPLSPEYLHFFATGGVSSGVSIEKIAATLKRKGQPVDADCPYLSTDPPNGWKPRARLTVFRRDSQERTGSSLNEIEQLIRGEQVPVLGIAVTIGFFTPRPPWNISSDGPVRGLHAVVGVGLGKFHAKRFVLIRNSWGFDWGANGYAWLDATYISRHLKQVLVLTDEVI
jgi:Papain family cysteine protease